MNRKARIVLSWLAESPGRRLAGNIGTFTRVEVGGYPATPGVDRVIVEGMIRDRLLAEDGPGYWKPSAGGYLEVRSWPPTKKPRSARPGRRPKAKAEYKAKPKPAPYIKRLKIFTKVEPGPCAHSPIRCPSCEELEERNAKWGRRAKRMLDRSRG